MEALLKKTIAAPFIPTVQDPNDLRHFDKEVTQQALTESILPATSIQEIQQHDQSGAFDHFGPVIVSSASDASEQNTGTAAATGGQQQQRPTAREVTAANASAAEEEKKE